VAAFAHYDAIAAWYDEQIRDGGLVHDLLLPSLLELAGDVAGQQVCDLACGQGVVARLLAERGAHVIGIDSSAALIAIARDYETAAPLGIIYRQDDAQHLATVPDGAFDGIACNMALHDIPDLTACARAIARTLLPGGWFAFAVTHPCLEVLRGQDRLVADAEGTITATRDYFIEGPWRSDNPNGVRGRVPVHHRTCATLLNAFAAAGLVLEQLVEPQPGDELGDQLARFREMPGFLLARYRRP
jgi:SAM-dependent methyltransferase